MQLFRKPGKPRFDHPGNQHKTDYGVEDEQAQNQEKNNFDLFIHEMASKNKRFTYLSSRQIRLNDSNFSRWTEVWSHDNDLNRSEPVASEKK